MASINLLPRKEFEITTDEGTVIKGKFGTWSLKRFCDNREITLGQLQAKKPEEFTLSDVVDLILYAVEQKARETSQPFSFTDVHACSWCDELGGIFGAEVTKLFNHQASDVKQEEEKKTES